LQCVMSSQLMHAATDVLAIVMGVWLRGFVCVWSGWCVCGLKGTMCLLLHAESDVWAIVMDKIITIFHEIVLWNSV